MKAMILAAGRGERMGDLTSNTPKPLLKVGSQYLIEYSLHQLNIAGFTEVIINVSHLAPQIQAALGLGERYGLKITYSYEPDRLETGGGILKALPLLGDQPFLVLSADIISDYPLKHLPQKLVGLAHLVMVDNPVFHSQGDFGIQDGFAKRNIEPKLTFANIGIYSPQLFTSAKPGKFPLNHLLFPAIEMNKVTAEYYQGLWHNVGTPSMLSNIKLFST